MLLLMLTYVTYVMMMLLLYFITYEIMFIFGSRLFMTIHLIHHINFWWILFKACPRWWAFRFF